MQANVVLTVEPEWRWVDVVLPDAVVALARDAAVQASFDQSALRLLKSGDTVAAGTLRDTCLGFARAQPTSEGRIFWALSAAFFEVLALQLCLWDLLAKRTLSRIVLQDRMLARGETAIAARLMLDLLSFCRQAIPPDQAACVVLPLVRAAYGLTQPQSDQVDAPGVGYLAPALLQARKRIAVLNQTWSALSGGDSGDLPLLQEQFSQMGDAVSKLQVHSADLLGVMAQVMEATAGTGAPPAPALALEVASALLYLEALQPTPEPVDGQVQERSAILTGRLQQLLHSGTSQGIEAWMHALYRAFSVRQDAGSVVDDLHRTLARVDAAVRRFFLNPTDKLLLQEVPGQLAQMRGVFSVLGLEQAVLAMVTLRASVEQFLLDEIDVESARTGVFRRLGNSLTAIGFMIDVLSYQRELARKLFAYDEEAGEFICLMGSATIVVTGSRVHALDAALEDQTKVIGTLRIALAPYNIYLNEADEWSRRLITELGEWKLELHRPLPGSSIELAQSLARASETVGFDALTIMAGALEQALRHVQLQAQGSPAQAQVFLETSEVIRRLLHQFAAGFLKPPDQALLLALQTIAAERLPRFAEEAQVLLKQLGGALRQWTARPDNLGARSEVLRVLQSFKERAQFAGAAELGESARAMTAAIEGLEVQSLHTSGLAFLLTRFDELEARLERLRSPPGGY